VTRPTSWRAALGLLAWTAVPLPAAADWPLRGVVLADMGASRPGATFFAPPWLWVGTGQPVLSSPLWGSAPGSASLAPGPWRPDPVFDARAPGVSFVLLQDRQASARVEASPRSGAQILNFNHSAILNVGVSNAW
jgi:hypothetical protein